MTTATNTDFAPTAFAVTLDEGNTLCRRIDTVAQWVQDWDDNTGALALYSDATQTHSYVAKIEITGRSVRVNSYGSPFVRVRVTFADPEVTPCGADMIMVGGKFFTMADAQKVTA